MKFETLKKDYRKYWLIGSIVVMLLASVIFFVSTRANYKVTQKVNIANGIINYNPSDLTIVSIKVQNSSGGYDEVNSVPTSGYTLSNTSYCEINGTKDTGTSMEYKDDKVIIPVNTKNTKCYLYFDEAIFISDILASREIDKTRSGSITGVVTTNTSSTSATKGKIFSMEDDDGTSYVYAGSVDDNWVKFGGFYWRIIRINGDGTLRLIYNGTTTSQTGSGTQINEGYYYFSTSDGKKDDNKYLGYMYTDGLSHGTSISSYAKEVIDSWFSINLNKEEILKKISVNTGFCGDRGSNTGSSSAPNGTGGTGKTATYYAPRYRINNGGSSAGSTQIPTLKCDNSDDLYTVASANKGNKALMYPVGLITSDEAILSGGFGGKDNKLYYLYTGQQYWTMSPSYFNGILAPLYIISSTGKIEGKNVNLQCGLRPVINLKADTTFKAGTDGTTAHPYEVI